MTFGHMRALWKDLRLTACFFLGFCFPLLLLSTAQLIEPTVEREMKQEIREPAVREAVKDPLTNPLPFNLRAATD